MPDWNPCHYFNIIVPLPKVEELLIFSLSHAAKPPAAPPPQEQPVERAKVIFQYKSEQEDELDINVSGL